MGLPELAFESVDTISQADFAAWVADRARWDPHGYELLNGRVVMNPPAGYPHGSVAGRVAVVLGSFIRDHDLGEYLDSSQGFALASGDTVEPDHSFVSTERWQAMPRPQQGEFLRVTPDLVVEIISKSTASRDRGEKKAIYEANGVREYWLIDPRGRRVTRFVLEAAGKYGESAIFDAGESFDSAVLQGLRVEVAALFPQER